MTPALGAVALISRSFRLLFAHFGFLFPMAFVPALVLAGLSFFAFPSLPPDPAAALPPPPNLSELLLIFINILISFVITGVMCLAALDALLGKRHSLGEYLSQTLRHIGPIVALGFLVSVATGLGFVFLLVPGLYILARFLPWTPAVVFENAGWSGLGRAQALTEGYRWPLAGAALLLGLAIAAVVLVLSPALGLAAGSGLIAVLLEGVFAGFYYALIAIFTALVYLRLREIKEGLTTAEIAASID